MMQVWRPTKKSLRPTGWETLHYTPQLFPETQNLILIDIICPNHNPDEPFSRKIIHRNELNDFLANNDWTLRLKSFEECHHALNGQTLRVNSYGTNPYVYTDFDRNVVYNEKGLPVGSNSEIVENIGKALGFKVRLNLASGGSASSFDNKTGKWTGPNGNVSKITLTM